MRITIVVHQFPPHYFTGTESYALAVGRELQRRGHDVDVFALHPQHDEADQLWRESQEQVEGLPVRRVTFWWRLGRDWERMDYRHPMMAAVFAEHLRQRDSHVVHSFHLRHVGGDLIDEITAQQRRLVVSLTDFWFLCPRIVLMRNDGNACSGPPATPLGCIPCHQPTLVDEYGMHPAGAELLAVQHAAPAESTDGPGLRPRLATLLERPAYLRKRLLAADAIVAPTQFLRQVFVQNGYPADRILHRSYGIDTTGIAEGARAARLGARPLTFGYFGSFAPFKAPHLLIAALSHGRGDCRVVLRGRPSDFPDYSRGLLAAAARDSRVLVLPPFTRDELPAALGGIDVLVVPSLWHENAPFVALEARAAGLPVLASRFGGLAEVVRDGVDGELFTAGDAADLGARMQRLVDDPAHLERLRAGVQAPKSLTVAVDEFEALYAGDRG